MSGLEFNIHLGMVVIEIIYIFWVAIKIRHVEKGGLLLHLACSFIYIYSFAKLQRATSYSEAILANKMEYIGSTFSALSFLLFLREYLDVKVPKGLSIFFVIGNMSVLASILNLETNQYFYTYVNYIESNGVIVLQKGHGILYYFFVALTVFMDAFCAGLVASYYTRQKRVRSVECITVMGAILMPVISYSLYLTEIGIDPVSYGYFLSDTFIVIMVINKKFYDVLHSNRESIYNNLKEGFLLLDRSEHVRDHNLTMERIVGQVIEDGLPLDEVYLGELGIGNGVYEYKNHVYSVTCEDVRYKKRVYGKLVTFTDITNHQEEVRRLEYFAKKAQSADDAKRKFLMSVSHRLRTPLNTIMGINSYIAELTQDNEEIYVGTRNIKDASVELLELIDDILMMADEKSTDALDELLTKPAMAKEVVNQLEFKDVKPTELGVELPRRVLIVDDTESNCTVLKLLLKKNGIESDVALSGADALELCKDKHYSLVVMDYMMPDMDGFLTFSNLRKRNTGLNANVPVILFSADVTGGIKQRALDAGFVSYLSKPVNKEIFMAEYEFWTNTYNLNTQKGLELCDDDTSIYNEVKNAFYDDWSNKLSLIDETFVSGDMGKYRTLVHGVKSAALYIGGFEVSDLAKAQEYGVKENRIDFVKAHHEEFMQRLEIFLKWIEGLEVKDNEENT